MHTNESQDVTAMGFTMAELVRLRRLCGRAGGIDELERLVHAAEAAQERDRALQRIRTPENLNPYSAASTASASDLRWAFGQSHLGSELRRFKAYRERTPHWWVAWGLLAGCLLAYVIGLSMEGAS